MPAGTHSVATRPSTQAGSLSIVPNLGFEPRTSRTWAARLYQVGLDRLGVDGRDRTGARTLARCGATSTPHPHGAFGQIRTGGLPRTGGTLYRWSYEGAFVAGEPGFGPGLRGPKPRGLPITPFPIRAPGRNRTCGCRLTKAPLYRLSYRGAWWCARRELNPQHPASRADLSASLEYEHMEPPPGADPGLLPYGGRVTSRVRRHSWGIRIRT
jgi:hypothetical protein